MKISVLKKEIPFMNIILSLFILAYMCAYLIIELRSTSHENSKYRDKTSKIQYNTNSTAERKRVCYYQIPKQNRLDKTLKNLDPENIISDLCTHILIAFAHIYNETIIPKANADINIYKRVMALKKTNPNLKVMLSLNNGFSDLVKSQESINLFAYNAHQFLVDHNFDGLDLDWEFPSWPHTAHNLNEKKEFTYLVIQLWNCLKLSSNPPLLLSIAVAAQKPIVRYSYEVKQLSQNVDFINLMGYDFRFFWPYFPFTGHNSPLYESELDMGYFATLNIAYSANYWVEKGVPKEKLVVGIPTYGRSWKLLSFLWNKLGAPAVGSGSNNGYVTYPEVLAFIKKGAVRRFDQRSRVPFSSMGTDWISHEDRGSIAEKVMWIKNGSFAGVMTWNLNCDDYLGTGSGRKFDLHFVIKEIMEK